MVRSPSQRAGFFLAGFSTSGLVGEGAGGEAACWDEGHLEPKCLIHGVKRKSNHTSVNTGMVV